MRILVLLKMNLRLLLRNKGFLFFLILLPIGGMLILNLKTGSQEMEVQFSPSEINELDHADSKIIYLGDTSHFSVKVYDSSGSVLGDELLKQFTDVGVFGIYRYHSNALSEEEILKLAKENGFNDRIGAIIYLKPDFQQQLLNGTVSEGMTAFCLAEDERIQLFEEVLNTSLTTMTAYAQYAQGDAEQLIQMIDQANTFIPEKERVLLSGGEGELTNQQMEYHSNLGYNFSILTMAFLFCGVFIAYTVIEERDNLVYTRMTLGNVTRKEYFVSKLIVAFVVTGIQTLVIGIGMPFLVRDDIGVGRIDYLIMIFLMGSIFNVLSLCVGTLMGNVMSANYMVFTIWSVSSLLSGLYFLHSFTVQGIIGKFSRLMPQKWFVEGAKMLMLQEKWAYPMMLSATMAFLIIICCVGVAGTRFQNDA